MAKSARYPLIYDYLRKYQEDPHSRVFAPLAEAYRKAGLIDEAVKIAREGLTVHPGFVGGRVALARALFDQKKYQEVVDELANIVQDVPDNLVAQRLLGDSSLMLGRVPEALTAYKMLLYFAPQDFETVNLVQELEAQAYEKGTLILRSDPEPLPSFNEQPATAAIEEDPDRKRRQKIIHVEKLQSLLQKVERYRVRNEVRERVP